MKEINEYKIASNFSPNELIAEVNQLIKEGWQPTGGVFILQSQFPENVGEGIAGIQTVTYQAMVRIA